MTQWASRKETAVALGVSRQRIEQLIAKGVLAETDQGIDLEAARTSYAARIDVVRKAQHESVKSLKSGAPPSPPPAARVAQAEPVPVTPSGVDKPISSIDYNIERARREKANADLQEMSYQLKSGQLISRDEVKAREFAVARKLRDRILGFPAKVANYVPPEAMKIITDEFEALIREMQEDAARISEQTPH